jgi:hypothetical protein
MHEQVIRWAKLAAIWLERFLALVLLLGIVVFTLKSATVLAGLDWHATETFYQLVYRVLVLVIGVELVRTLVTHDLNAVLELLAFVVARKLLKPELSTLEILLGVGAFVGLLAARRFFLRPSADVPGA